uniref:Uncharacterized protein n=1 Tax=viral metagenome TaxID=1070528 RepID=A0A6H2A015_9ZZZZ
MRSPERVSERAEKFRLGMVLACLRKPPLDESEDEEEEDEEEEGIGGRPIPQVLCDKSTMRS